MYRVGAGFTVVATAIVYHTTFYGQIPDETAKWVGMTTVFAAEFLAGAALTALFGFARAIRRMGNRRDCTLRLSRDQFGVLSTGTLMFKCWCVALVLWMLYQIPNILEMVETSPLSVLQSPAVIALALPTLVLMLLFFYWCQLPLHQRMLETKRAEIVRLQEILDATTPKTLEGASDELIKKVQFFEARLLREQALPEWPSTLVASMGTIGVTLLSTQIPSLLSPLLKTAVGHVFGTPLS
jgi:hypothetical protein